MSRQELGGVSSFLRTRWPFFRDTGGNALLQYACCYCRWYFDRRAGFCWLSSQDLEGGSSSPSPFPMFHVFVLPHHQQQHPPLPPFRTSRLHQIPPESHHHTHQHPTDEPMEQYDGSLLHYLWGRCGVLVQQSPPPWPLYDRYYWHREQDLLGIQCYRPCTPST